MTPGMWLTAAVAVIGVATVSARPPSEEALASIGSSYSTWARGEGRESTPEARRAYADELLQDVAVEELDVEGLRVVAGPLRDSSMRSAALARLITLAGSPDADGATAAVLAVDMQDAAAVDSRERAMALARVLKHPGFDALVRERGPVATGYVWALADGVMKDGAVLAAVRPDLGALGRAVPEGASRDIIAGGAAVIRAMAEAGPAGAADLEAMRSRFTELAQAGRESAEEQTKVRWDRLIRLLDSPAMRGPVVGSKATPLTIEWSSDPAITSFEDLRGKVVVVDFWATWCPPCNASFPDIRKLHAHYEGYPVVVLGVTSIQGRHIGPDGSIPTTGDPEKERSLMPEFIARKDLTWPIVFTQQAAHNTDYGVVGIPHVTIIDPDGVVRYNGLSPFEPLPEKAAKIDAILREFNLPSPSAKSGT